MARRLLRSAGSGGIAHQYIVVLKGGLPAEPTKRSEKEATAEDERVALLGEGKATVPIQRRPKGVCGGSDQMMRSFASYGIPRK